MKLRFPATTFFFPSWFNKLNRPFAVTSDSLAVLKEGRNNIFWGFAATNCPPLPALPNGLRVIFPSTSSSYKLSVRPDTSFRC